MKNDFDYTIEFINKDFDLAGELPEEYNAGNRCYGRDVAEYIKKNLNGYDIKSDCIDEDWGWLLYGEIKTDHRFEIYIYPWGFLEDAKGDDFHLWRLRLRCKEKSKVLGIFSSFKTAKCNETILDALRGILGSGNNTLRRMEEGLEW